MGVIQRLEQAVNNPLYTHPWRSYSAAGLCMLNKGKAKEAEDFFQRALRLEPDDPRAHDELGNAYRKLGRTDLAQSETEAARKLRAARGGGAP